MYFLYSFKHEVYEITDGAQLFITVKKLTLTHRWQTQVTLSTSIHKYKVCFTAENEKKKMSAEICDAQLSLRDAGM